MIAATAKAMLGYVFVLPEQREPAWCRAVAPDRLACLAIRNYLQVKMHLSVPGCIFLCVLYTYV